MDHFGVDSCAAGCFEAMNAKAQTKQVGSYGPQLLKVALVVVAVREAVEVKRLREDRRDLIARDVRRERARVGSHFGIGRAQIGEVPVPERVLCGALGMREAEPVVVQEDRPCVYLHFPFASSSAKVAEG